MSEYKAENYENLLLEIAGKDERLVVLTAENRAAIRNLPEPLGDRFIDVGIAEMTMVGAAAGLALRGRIPVVHALATFLTLRAYEFVRTDVGIAHAPVKLVGYVPGLLSEANGPTHQAIEDVGIMAQIPGMRVFCPADNDELLAGLAEVLADPHPWYIRFNDKPSGLHHESGFGIGRAETLRGTSGTADVALLTYGLLTAETVRAADLLTTEGLHVRCLNLRTLAPLDEEAVVAAADARVVVSVEDHLKTGGLYSRLCEIFQRRGVGAKLAPVALDTWFQPGLLDAVKAHEGLDARGIAAAARQALNPVLT